MKNQDLIELEAVLRILRGFILDSLQKNKLEARRKQDCFLPEPARSDQVFEKVFIKMSIFYSKIENFGTINM